MRRLGLSRSALYARIAATATELHLPPPQAALALAAAHNINYHRFASDEDRAVLRDARRTGHPVVVHAQDRSVNGRAGLARQRGDSRKRTKDNTVWVVHGRDLKARDDMFALLRSVGLQPIEWVQALKMSRKAAPYTGEILEAAFNTAAAVVVLLTPDDEARLKKRFRVAKDPLYERELTGQARPNVLFEAGMAFGRHPKNTVIVQLGDVRPFSDVAGRHVVHLSGSVESRRDLLTKLENAGCRVDISGNSWMTVGNFAR